MCIILLATGDLFFRATAILQLQHHRLSRRLGEPSRDSEARVKKTAPHLADNGPFVVMNADILTDMDLEGMPYVLGNVNHWCTSLR